MTTLTEDLYEAAKIKVNNQAEYASDETLYWSAADRISELETENKQLLLDRRSCHLMIGKLARKADHEEKREAIEFCVRQDPNAFSPLRRED